MPEHATPRWMIWLLRVAAAYNVLWGTMTFLFPTQMFTAGGLPAPNYPSMVQCVGVLVGVFGVGYALASRDPVAQWGIVLVGLLSKLLAPIGFVAAVFSGELPPTMFAAILLNDVVWWLPFAAILLHAARVNSDRGVPAVGSLADELQRHHTATGQSLWELSFQHPVLIVFVRHLGCTFCREALGDLRQQAERIATAGVKTVVVHMASAEEGQQMLDRYGLQDVTAISDPERRLFRAFELPLGTWWQLFGLGVVWRALAEGVIFRYGFGRMVGNPLQLTGAFLVDRGQIVRSARLKSTAERPNYADMACGTPLAG
jgi:peroxiredoxin